MNHNSKKIITFVLSLLKYKRKRTMGKGKKEKKEQEKRPVRQGPKGTLTERLNPLNDILFLKFMGENGDEEQSL
jgi:hypothetical protein